MMKVAIAVFLGVALVACGGEDSATENPDEPNGDTPTDPDPGDPDPDPYPEPVPDPRVVCIDDGCLRGAEVSDSLAFLGVPYAAPPVGELRWAPPQPPAAWTDVRPAEAAGHECPQAGGFGAGDQGEPMPTGDEDCLFLNVWRPATEAAPRPVMVFLHGGANTNGSGLAPLGDFLKTDSQAPVYDGAKLAAVGDVVVVTLNYRLGALGFLTHDSLLERSGNGHVGNYGMLDQIAALEWVRDHIAAFGGDPGNVTLFGQSAGSYDTCSHVTSPITAGLFHKAILQSGICSVHPEDRARNTAQALIEEFGCDAAPDVLECLQNLTWEELVLAEAAQPNGIGDFAFYPHVDGWLFPVHPDEALTAGAFSRVPVMVGTNEAEYSNRESFQNLRAEDYGTQFRVSFLAQFVDTVPQPLRTQFLNDLMALYPMDAYPTPGDGFIDALTDRNLTCTNRRIAARLAEAENAAPVYRYYFRHVMASELRLGAGAYHGLELLYLFQKVSEHVEATPADEAVEALLARVWGTFARTGAPPEDLGWAPYVASTDPYFVLSEAPYGTSGLDSAHCDLWDDPFGLN